jgi:hypothetical protein
VTITGANEYGAICAAKIFGIEILNEGWGSSIDDAVSEMQATFVARTVEPMAAVASPNRPAYLVFLSCRKPRPSRARGDGEGSGVLPGTTLADWDDGVRVG